MKKIIYLTKICEMLPPPITLLEENGFCRENAENCKYCVKSIENRKYICNKKLFAREREIVISLD